MSDLPCIDCVTLAMCINKGKQTNGTTNLAHKCSLLSNWLMGPENGYDIEKIYAAYVYFARGEVEEIDPATL